MSTQGLRQASVRAVTGTSLDYNGDFYSLFVQKGITAGDFDGMMLQWLNHWLGKTYDNLPGAMAAFAAANGADTFSSVGTFDASVYYSTEALTVFDQFTTAPTSTRKGQIATLVDTMKTKGILAQLDLFYVLAAADAQAAKVNWKSTSYGLTATGTTTFTADRGIKGNGVDGRLNATGYNPSTITSLVTLNSATVGLYIRTAATAGVGQDLGGGSMRMNRNASTYGTRINDGTGINIVPAAYTGHFATRRTASNAATVWVDGVNKASAATVSTSVISSFNILANNTGVIFSDAEISVAYVGAAFTDQQMADMNSAIGVYLTAVGA